jgi:SNF2 family DNA or RNA helicase
MADEENTGALVLKLIISLKQICNHPRNFDKTSPIDPQLSGKAQQLLALLETILQRNEKVLIGCNLKNTNLLYFLKKKLNNFLTTPYFP